MYDLPALFPMDAPFAQRDLIPAFKMADPLGENSFRAVASAPVFF